MYLDYDWGPDASEQITDFLTDLHHYLATQAVTDPAQYLDERMLTAHHHYHSEKK